jgi:hypothetical protein
MLTHVKSSGKMGVECFGASVLERTLTDGAHGLTLQARERRDLITGFESGGVHAGRLYRILYIFSDICQDQKWATQGKMNGESWVVRDRRSADYVEKSAKSRSMVEVREGRD